MNLLIRKYLPSKINFIISLFILFSILKTGDCYAQWILQYHSSQVILDIRFINKKTGWACGNNQILKTTNGGENWSLLSIPSTGYFTQIHPVNDSVVYVCGWYVILKTTDGGNNWTIIRVGQDQVPELAGLWFINENTGWFCGDRVVMRTTNGGSTFVDSMNQPTEMKDIHFKNESEGVIIGYALAYKTINSGVNWYSVILPSSIATPFCDRVTFIGDTGWTASWGNVVFRTTNYGISWDSITRIADEHTHSTRCIEFSSLITGYAGGSDGKIFKTTDGGFNWHILQTQQFGLGYYVSIFAYTDSLVWAVGGGGNIINTKNGGETIVNIKSPQNIENKDFTLVQNFPNPFNPATNIKVIINKSKFVKIIVYNHLGKEIKILSDKFLNSGEYSFKFDGNILPSGVYFYKIITNNFSETKKMILIR
jgi:photosystem II stability/assembly factor-like uncharacterized protein